MKKLKFPEDFFAYDNPDCPDKDIEKAVNRMKNWMKGETYKSNPWFFMAAGKYLIVGLIAEDWQKTIYVARQYYEIVSTFRAKVGCVNLTLSAFFNGG